MKGLVMFSKEELEVIEKISYGAESDVQDCLRRTEDFPKAFVEYCKEMEPVIKSILEKVRKM